MFKIADPREWPEQARLDPATSGKRWLAETWGVMETADPAQRLGCDLFGEGVALVPNAPAEMSVTKAWKSGWFRARAEDQ